MVLLFTYNFYYLCILLIYFSSFDTIFDWLTPLSAMLSYVGGGPHTNHHNVFMFCSSFVFRGIVNKYVYSVR